MKENEPKTITASPLQKAMELLPGIAAGCETAFRQLFHLYWEKVYAAAFDFTKSEPVAEEIVQDVFLKIWLVRDRLLAVEKFDDYLFIIARNHMYNTLRKKSAEQPFAEHLGKYFLETSYQPEQALCYKETRNLVNSAVELLPLQQRLVFTLSRNEGFDHNQIAQKLGISKLTVKSHMNRALQFIRLYLQEQNGEIIYFLLFVANVYRK